MSDCFISYSTHDQHIANFIYSELVGHGLDVFMASVSLKPGEHWSQQIFANLQASSWVIFLASKSASQSPYVQQELGMALGANKKLIPIVWDMFPSELPGWVNRTHALDLRNATIPLIKSRIAEIANSIHQDKQKGFLIAAAVVAAIIISGRSA